MRILRCVRSWRSTWQRASSSSTRRHRPSFTEISSRPTSSSPMRKVISVSPRSSCHWYVSVDWLFVGTLVCKIADFGLSRGLVWNERLEGKVVDNPIWLAPEVLRHQKYTEKVRLIILYILFFFHLHDPLWPSFPCRSCRLVGGRVCLWCDLVGAHLGPRLLWRDLFHELH